MILPRAVDARGGIYFNPRSFSSDSTTVMRTTLDDDAMTALGNVKPQGMRRIEDGRSIQVVPLNMTPEDDWAVGLDGTVVFVRSDGYYLEILRPDGSTVRGSTQDIDLLRPSDEDKLAYLEERAAGGIMMGITVDNGERRVSMSRGGGGGRGEPDIDELEWPRRMPAFRAGETSIAPDGRIFVGRTVHAGEPSLFDVFNDRAELIGNVEFGPRTSIVGFGANGAIYLAETDMFGLQWLKKVTVG